MNEINNMIPGNLVIKIRCSGLIWLWLTLLVFATDQITKLLSLYYLFPYDPLTLLPFFNFTLAFNTGAAFNFLSSAGGWQRWLLGGVAILVSCVLITWLYKTPREQKLLSAALTLILGGALGNLWDRLSLGYVIDFLDFHIAGWHWPAFNIADSAITLGAFLLILSGFFKKTHSLS